MSLESWHKVLDPKVKGTINLHEALLHEPLDFFVMTSSTLGTVGASTQSNYAAANAFLDSMARHRWSLGLEACSIALGMVVGVGHVESHPGEFTFAAHHKAQQNIANTKQTSKNLSSREVYTVFLKTTSSR